MDMHIITLPLCLTLVVTQYVGRLSFIYLHPDGRLGRMASILNYFSTELVIDTRSHTLGTYIYAFKLLFSVARSKYLIV